MPHRHHVPPFCRQRTSVTQLMMRWTSQTFSSPPSSSSSIRRTQHNSDALFFTTKKDETERNGTERNEMQACDSSIRNSKCTGASDDDDDSTTRTRTRTIRKNVDDSISIEIDHDNDNRSMPKSAPKKKLPTGRRIETNLPQNPLLLIYLYQKIH